MSDMDEQIKTHIIDIIKSKEFKKTLVKELNDCVDIPMINEKTEKKIMNKLCNVVLQVVINKIDNEI
jgi:hypothetical protein